MSSQRHTIFAQIKSDSSLIGSRIQTSTIWSCSPSHWRVAGVIWLVCAVLHRIRHFRANIYFKSIYAPLFRTVFLRTELLVSVSQRGRSARGIRFYPQRRTPQFLFNEPICISSWHINVFNFLRLPSMKRFEACRIPCWTFSNTPLRILIIQLSLGLLLEAKVLQDGFLGVLHSPTWRSWEGTHFGWGRFLGGRLIMFLTIIWRFIVASLDLHLVALVDSDLRREG